MTTVVGMATPAESGSPGESGPVSSAPSADELDVAVLTLFIGYTSAWELGVEAGVSYLVEHDHPALDYSVEDCLAGYSSVPPGYLESFEPDMNTIRLDPEFTLPFGRYSGQVLDGFIYAVDVNVTRGDPDGQGLISEALVLHVVYLNREAYLFNVCEY